MSLFRKQIMCSWLTYAAVATMLIVHAVGIIGLNGADYLFFERLAGPNLLFSFLLIMPFQKKLNGNFILFCFICFVCGMAVEIAGVNTGYPFGNYYYTPTFGWHILGVPVIIGINWVLLSYVSGIAANQFLNNDGQRILAASVLMVSIDLLLESFATKHHMWVWQNGNPPLQNYVSWFIAGIIMQSVFQKLIPASSNKNAAPYLLILIAFLIADLLWISR
jgi:uncharacterized membrane protein